MADPPLRQRKRAATMQRIQRSAFELLTERGYEGTKITDIAGLADVSPSTVYRYFGTKERIFVWDPLAEPFVHLLDRHASVEEPMRAIEHAFLDLAIHIGPTSEEALRTHTRQVMAIPELRSAMWRTVHDLDDEVVAVFVARGSTAFEARVMAAVVSSALMVGIEEWARPGSEATFVDIIRTTFTVLRRS